MMPVPLFVLIPAIPFPCAGDIIEHHHITGGIGEGDVSVLTVMQQSNLFRNTEL